MPTTAFVVFCEGNVTKVNVIWQNSTLFDCLITTIALDIITPLSSISLWKSSPVWTSLVKISSLAEIEYPLQIHSINKVTKPDQNIEH